MTTAAKQPKSNKKGAAPDDAKAVTQTAADGEVAPKKLSACA
jgi:hypothetical protein